MGFARQSSPNTKLQRILCFLKFIVEVNFYGAKSPSKGTSERVFNIKIISPTTGVEFTECQYIKVQVECQPRQTRLTILTYIKENIDTKIRVSSLDACTQSKAFIDSTCL
jgi:hypothetical protein